MNKIKQAIFNISNEILDFLLKYKAENPDFTFSLRSRDSPQSDEVRLGNGQWFQGSDYIYVPLFKKGDSNRKIKTLGFVLGFNENGSVTSNYIEISFKGGIDTADEIAFHKELAKKIGLKLPSDRNHGEKYYNSPKDYLENLKDYIVNTRKAALQLLKKYNLIDKYLISENEFQRRIKIINNIKEKLISPESKKITGQPDKTEIYLQSSIMKHPLNQILFGPPGTGKTYNTINKALEIINEEAEQQLDWSNREAVKAQFHKRVEESRIVFSTFHQNMTYEDFIEGIKPSLEDDENEKVNYSIVDGILKSLSKKAISEYFKIQEPTPENKTANRLQLFDEAWNNLAEAIQSKLDSEELLELFSLTNKPLEVLRITQQGNFILKPKIGNAEEYTVSYARTQKLFQAFANLKEVKNMDKEFRQVIGGSNSTAYWCVLNYLNTWIETHPGLIQSAELKPINESLISFDNHIVNANKNVPRYVLIIDEINRGNVSQIFGELITLIEEDKRLGNDEALLATLPYSKKKFGVPPNLYLIGTMNTADRSVEALDTALRRRFSFQEMPPVPELITTYGKLKAREGAVNGINLAFLLNKINSRIEKLLDKDHLIGHSFFMQVDTIDKLKETFQNKIIPLLQEYFYGDFGKIELVLGAGFVREKNLDVTGLFAKSKYDTSSLEDKPVYELINHTKEVEYTLEIDKVLTKIDFETAIKLLLNV
ncbi:MAG: AAA family ATPase [Daejeonella sp.]